MSIFILPGYREKRLLFTTQLQIGAVLFAIRLRLPRKIQLSLRAARTSAAVCYFARRVGLISPRDGGARNLTFCLNKLTG